MGKLINVTLLLTFAIFVFSSCQSASKMTIPRFNDHQIVRAKIGHSPVLNIEVVKTPVSITQGLSGRDELGADGMLFVFRQPRIPSFWMKEMKFDLDLVWIRDMKVVEVTENVPAPDSEMTLNELPTYSPIQSVDMVLEIRAGQSQEWKVYIGSELFFEGV